MATNAELVQAIKDWKDQIVDIVSDYKDAIAKLDSIESNFKSNKWELLKLYLPFIAQIVTVISIVGFLIFYSTRVECGVTLKAVGIEISRVCQ